MSRSSGAGSPLSFRCFRCRVFDGAWGPKSRRGWRHRVRLTGKTRAHKAPTGSALGARSTLVSRQYECLDCGHTGWSAHKDLEEKKE